MPSISYTKIVKRRSDVQLKKNSYATLPPIDWRGFESGPSNQLVVDLNKDGVYDDKTNSVWFLGSTNSQRITGRKSATNNVDGGAGNDTIIGGDLVDWLYGSDGNDSLSGGGGNDRISGGKDNDTILGGAGMDLLYGDAGNDSLDGGDGNDTLTGGDGSDIMKGGAGQDVIFADAGNDTIDGGDGADILYGGSGNDRISGGGGQFGDTIVGGAGADTLNGGRGKDEFVFNQGDSTVENSDTIESFALGSDILWIDWANYTTTVTQSAPLVVDIKQVGTNAELTFNFNAKNSGIDYRMILKDFSVASLGTGTTFQRNLTDMFYVFDASKVSYS